jgi:two-component system NarL family sensor kinase
VSYTYFQRLPFIQSFQETREIFGIIALDYLRNLMPMTFLANVIGFFYLKLHTETEAKQAALTLVQAQNEVLIESEERSRSSVAHFLHDRVQAALVTVSMQLGEISESLPAKSKARINSVISEIEHIRRVEVRSAAQRLSPDLAVIGLVSALKLNSEALKTSVRTRVITDKSVENLLKPSVENEHLQLGIYRIVEQVMLNAVVHGRAQNIVISFTFNDKKLITVVTNDGKEIEEETTAGSGTAIIGSWLSILNGTYTLENTSNHGVRFVMEIPVYQ